MTLEEKIKATEELTETSVYKVYVDVIVFHKTKIKYENAYYKTLYIFKDKIEYSEENTENHNLSRAIPMKWLKPLAEIWGDE